MKIKVVLFDIDGVMIRCPHYFWEELENRWYKNATEILAEFFSEKNKDCTEWKTDIQTEMKPYLERVWWKKSVDDFLKEQYSFESNFFDISFKKIVTNLQGQWIYCALATSQEYPRAKYMLKNLSFEELFDDYYISCNIGFRKDSPKYWEHVLHNLTEKIANIQPNEIAFFDDQQKLVDEAKNHWIQAIMFTNMKQFQQDMNNLWFEINMNTKQELISLIQNYWKKYPKEKWPSRCIQLLEKYSDERVFYRDHFDDGHFTGSVLVVNPERTKVLMMHHKKYGTWQQFGGHVDGEINIRNAAIRELEEEAGIHERDIVLSKEIFHFDIHSVPRVWNEPEHFHYDVSYLAIVDDDLEYIKQEAEVHDIQWFEIPEVVKQLWTWKFSSGFEHIFEKINS